MMFESDYLKCLTTEKQSEIGVNIDSLKIFKTKSIQDGRLLVALCMEGSKRLMNCPL